MLRSAMMLVAIMSPSTTVLAQDWGSYFNMDTFGAGGGSDANGWLNFECAYADKFYPASGQALMEMRIIKGLKLAKKSLPADITFRVDNGQSYVLPMSLDMSSVDDLSYDYSLETTPVMLNFIAALRRGSRVEAYFGETRLINVGLEQSNDVLDPIEDCAKKGP